MGRPSRLLGRRCPALVVSAWASARGDPHLRLAWASVAATTVEPVWNRPPLIGNELEPRRLDKNGYEKPLRSSTPRRLEQESTHAERRRASPLREAEHASAAIQSALLLLVRGDSADLDRRP